MEKGGAEFEAARETEGISPRWQAQGHSPLHTHQQNLNRSADLGSHESARKCTGTAIIYAFHLPMGQSSCGSHVFRFVKQPQIRQRVPVCCSHDAHVRSRFCRVSALTVCMRDFRNFVSDRAAESAM